MANLQVACRQKDAEMVAQNLLLLLSVPCVAYVMGSEWLIDYAEARQAVSLLG